MVAIIIMAANATVQAAPPLDAIRKVKAMVEDARYQLPADAGYGLMLTQVNYDSKTYTIIYRYHYINPTQKPSPSTISEVKKGLIHMLKANPNSEDMQLLKAGFTFHYNYYNPDGSFLYANKITPADVR